MPRRPHPRALAPALLALLLLATVAPSVLGAAAAAPNTRVATILVRGLQRVDRERLLADLELSEGGPYAPGLEQRVERRATDLPYLRSLQVESRPGTQGVHLLLKVREARVFRVAPTVFTLDDGDLDGGLRLTGIAPLGRGESWEGLVFVGSFTEASLRMDGLRLGARLPRLHLEFGVSDYDDPFRLSQVTRWWSLAGPGFRLPGGAGLVLLGGWERMDSAPPVGRDPDGSEAHGLFRLALEQPLPGPELALSIEAELRSPTDERGYAHGVAALSGEGQLGRWVLQGRVAGGMAQHRSPVSEIYFMDAWRWLHLPERGKLPAREFQFARFRADLPLLGLPVRLRRGAPPETVRLGPYVLLEAARFREYRRAGADGAGDWGLGLGALLPGRPGLRASLGVQWSDAGEPRTLFLLEER